MSSVSVTGDDTWPSQQPPWIPAVPSAGLLPLSSPLTCPSRRSAEGTGTHSPAFESVAASPGVGSGRSAPCRVLQEASYFLGALRAASSSYSVCSHSGAASSATTVIPFSLAPCSGLRRGARRHPVPVIGVDEQVQVARVHVIHDVLAVGVDHLHIILHLLLHSERGRGLSLAPWPWASHNPLCAPGDPGTKCR